MANGKKKCKLCGVPKDLADFYNMKSQADGKHYYCKDCCAVKRGAERVRKRDRSSKISYRQQHRARGLGLESEVISIAKLFERDGGICQICFERVNTRHASIDHIHPLQPNDGSTPGTHTWDNVQLTHVRCNKKKSNKVIPKKDPVLLGGSPMVGASSWDSKSSFRASRMILVLPDPIGAWSIALGS